MQKLSRAFILAATVALCYTATSWAVAPKIVCGNITAGSATVGWQTGDNTAYGGVSGFATTCGATRLVYFSWNGGPWTTVSTFATSPGQSGTLQVQVGDSDMNYCDPTAGLNCNYGASTNWTNPNTGGPPPPPPPPPPGSPPSLTAFTSNTPVASGTSTLLYYTVSGAASCTFSQPIGQVAVSSNGSFTLNAGVQAAGTVTYSLYCSNQYGDSGSLTTTVVTQAPTGDTGPESACLTASPPCIPFASFVPGSDANGTSGIGNYEGQCTVLYDNETGIGSGFSFIQSLRGQSSLLMHSISVECSGVDEPTSITLTLCFYRNEDHVLRGCTSNAYALFPLRRSLDTAPKLLSCLPLSGLHRWRIYQAETVTWEYGPPTTAGLLGPPTPGQVYCA